MSQLDLFRPPVDPRAALAERDRGMATASKADRVQIWKEMATGYVRQLPPETRLTADQLVAAIGLPDDPAERERPNNVVGAMFSAWSKAGLLRWTGNFARSGRVVGHGNPQRVWLRTMQTKGEA